MKKIFFLTLCLCLTGTMFAQMKIERVEPLSWWTGMKTPLQLMFYGQRLQGAEVRCLEPGLQVSAVHTAESADYLFVDVTVAPDARPGTYTFEFTQGKKKIRQSYLLNARRDGSADRKGFGPEDMIYLLMPDRFANGDPLNDTHKGAEEKAGREHPYGRHGGDIQGVIDHLGYLQELGVTAIWPTPLLFDNEPGSSYHGYACADYYRVDPRYGTNELYRQLVEKSHERGIKFIMDMVPNHCGMAHWWMKDLPFASWINQFPEFTRSNFMMSAHFDPHASQADKDLLVQGWFDTSMPDMNMTNPYVLAYMTQMAVWWVEYAGLDGLRVDTYPYSDKQAMSVWTKNILNEYPRLNIVAESWYGLPSMVAYWEGANKNADGYTSHLPSVMDFPLMDALTQGLVKDSLPGWGEGLTKVYTSLSQDFLYADPNSLLIFADNHDTNRMAWLLKGKKDKQKMAMAMLATLRGVPQLYYGDEVMLYNKKKQGHGEERLDMPGGWPGDTHNVFVTEGRSKVENEVFEYTKKLFNWRKTAQVAHMGKMLHFAPEDNNFYVYFRYTGNELLMVAVNNTKEKKTVNWARYAEITGGYTAGTEIVSGAAVKIGEVLVVAPQQAQIIHFKK